MTAERHAGGRRDRAVFSAADVAALAGRIRGPLFLPGQDEYDEERRGFDLSVDHHPALIAGITGVGDVIAAVGAATDRGLPVAVQATGHGATVPADGAVLITTRRMAGVQVDPAARTARIEAGATWEPVIRQAAPRGLAPLSGSAPFVGAVSYALGGGLGLLGRRYGYAADHVRRLELVTAGGRLLRVSAAEHPDLFWALRGGKGNFGIVTAMEVELMPVSRLYGGGLYFPAEATREILHAYREWTATVPEEMSSSVALLTFPDVPQVPVPLRGRYVTHVRLAYLGGAAAGERLVRALRAAGPPLLDTVDDMPFTAVGSIHNDPRDPVPVYTSTMMLRALAGAAVETLVGLAGPEAPAPYVVELRHLGGALGRPAAVPNAVGHRDAAFSVYVGSVLDPDQAAAIPAAHEALREGLRPWATGAEVLNFIHGANTTPERVRAAYTAADYARLARLKARYDPQNTFRLNHNIPPDAGAGGAAAG